MSPVRPYINRRMEGPPYHSFERPAWDSEVLRILMARVRPTPEEMDMIHRAVERWGAKGSPTPSEIIGDRPRAGLESLVTLLALEQTREAA